MSGSLGPHELQHTRPPCPPPTHGVHPDSCPSSQSPESSSLGLSEKQINLVPYTGDLGLIPGSGREWLHTLVLLPGEFLEQKTLAGYSPMGHKESDMTEETEHAHTLQ